RRDGRRPAGHDPHRTRLVARGDPVSDREGPSMSAARSKLDLDPGVVEACRQATRRIADDVAARVAGKTTVSVERSVTRLLGVDGADELEVPLPNVLVDHVHEHGGLDRGIAYWLGNAMVGGSRTPQQVADAVSAGELELLTLERADEETIRARVAEQCGA